jgi:mannitol/fructose-specific phosphotransferase system IIA component (Ntr-type)
MKTTEIFHFLNERLFLPDLQSNNKEQVLEELIEPLIQTGNVMNKNLILGTLHNRETLGSTGSGKGVAIPHCRTLMVTEIFIVIGLSKKGILFDSVDKKKVHIFFLVIAPPQDKSNVYLPILGKIVEMVRDTKIRNAMLKASNFQEFLNSIQKGS